MKRRHDNEEIFNDFIAKMARNEDGTTQIQHSPEAITLMKNIWEKEYRYIFRALLASLDVQKRQEIITKIIPILSGYGITLSPDDVI